MHTDGMDQNGGDIDIHMHIQIIIIIIHIIGGKSVYFLTDFKDVNVSNTLYISLYKFT